MMRMRIGNSFFAILVMTAAVLALPTAAAAQSATTDIPFSTQVLNTCTGEMVNITGVQTTTSLTKIDNSGGFHISLAMVTKGTGIGVDTGTSYPYQENDLFKVYLGSSGSAMTTIRMKSRLKGPGSIDNWDLTFMVHLTINANGIASSVIDTFETTCRG
jgi:hypothetical protein